MKKCVCVLLFCLCIVCASLFGCNPEKESYFTYIDNIKEVTGDIVIGEKVFSVKWSFGDSEKIEILSPTPLAGVAVLKEGDSFYAVKDETKIPLSKLLAEGVVPFFSIFHLSDSDTLSITKSEGEKTEISASCNGDTVTVIRGDTIYPEKFLYTGKRNFEACNLIFSSVE